MSKIKVCITDNGGNKLDIGLTKIPAEEVEPCVATMLNKRSLVVDAWGYLDYDEAYSEIPNLSTKKSMELADSIFVTRIQVVEDSKDIEVDTEYTTKEAFMNAYDEYMLTGFEDYDPEVAPFDMREVLPTLGVAKYE